VKGNHGRDICQPHKCLCGSEVSARGLHGLACKRSAGRRSRHETANDIIARSLRSAEVPCIREPVGCSRVDGKRPDGLTLIPWSRGRSLVWDFTCADTYAPTYVATSAINPGSAAEAAHLKKQRKYDFLQGRFLFVPIAVETSGVWASEGLRLVREIGRRIFTVTGEVRAAQFLTQRMSIAIQRGNVAAVLGTLPPGKGLDEIFSL